LNFKKLTGKQREVYENVQDIIKEYFEDPKIKFSPKTSFKDDIGADSLEQIELMMVIEKRYEIVIEDELAEKIETVHDCVAVVVQKLNL
jgi:acyl carrier protein